MTADPSPPGSDAPLTHSLTLTYHNGSAEHLYQPGITAQKEGGYVVRVAHGRRGTLRIDTQTPSPLNYAHARRIFDGLVAKKIACGYVAETTEVPQLTRRPVCPEPGKPWQVARRLHHPDWCVQELLRGQRLLLCKTPGRLTGVTPAGLLVGVPETVRAAAERTSRTWEIDGVLAGDRFTAFDLPRMDVMNFRTQPYTMRLAGLGVVLGRPDPHLRIAETTEERSAKEAFVQRLRAAGRPGVVVKKLSGVYPCGCPDATDTWLQCLFDDTWPAMN